MRRRTRGLLAAIVVALPALVLYRLTLMPDVGFWDTAEFQAIGPVLGIAHPTGYPTYTLLAWLASVVLQPFGNEALRANLMSALAVAGAAAMVALTVTLLTRHALVGVATGLALAIAGEAWAIALHADPHALHLALVSLLLLILVVWGERVAHGRPADRWLVAAAAIFAVALGNHALTLLLAPGIALYLLFVDPSIVRRVRLTVICAITLAGLTVAIYLYLPLRSAMNPALDYGNPQTWDGFRYLVFAEQFGGDFGKFPSVVAALRLMVNETFDQLGAFALLAVGGAIAGSLRRPGLVLLLVSWFTLNWFFALGYDNADISRYYLVPIMSAAVLGGIGAGALWDLLAGVVRSIWPGLSATATGPVLALLGALLLVGPTIAAVPDRFRSVDELTDLSGRIWLTSVTRALPQNAVVVSWWSYSTTLWYGQFVEHLRPDVSVIDDSTIEQQDLGSPQAVIDSYLGRRPVFLIRLPFDVQSYEQRYSLTPLPDVIGGTVYRVEPLSGPLPHALL